MPNLDLLKTLIDLRDRVLQKERIAWNNRLAAIKNGADTGSPEEVERLTFYMERFGELEKLATEDIQKYVKDLVIVEYMCWVKGIGPILAAKVIAHIDIDEPDTVSAMWRYCGYSVVNSGEYVYPCGHEQPSNGNGPVDASTLCATCNARPVMQGKAERPTKGERLHYNARLKSACFLVAESLVRTGSPYREIYDKAKEYYELNRPSWNKMHIHRASQRKMVKVWLAHLWLVWRTIEGLPADPAYPDAILNHSHIYPPEYFGWPSLDELNQLEALGAPKVRG